MAVTYKPATGTPTDAILNYINAPAWVRKIYQTAQATQPAPYRSPYNAAYGNPTVNPFALQPFQYGGSAAPRASSPPAYSPSRVPGNSQYPAPTNPQGSTFNYGAPATPASTPGNPQGSTFSYSGAGSNSGTGAGTGGNLDWLTSTGIWRNYNSWVDRQSGMTYAATANAAGLDPATGFSRWYFNEYLPRYGSHGADRPNREAWGYTKYANRGRRGGSRGGSEPGAEPGAEPVVDVQSLRYAPPPTSWRIG